MRNNKPVLLCPTVCCCPEIFLEGDNFIIKDDYNGKIIIPQQDIESLIKQLDEFVSLPGDSLDS